VLARRGAARGASGKGDRDPTGREGGLVTTRAALISDNWPLLRVSVIARRAFSEYNGTIVFRGEQRREKAKGEARREQGERSKAVSLPRRSPRLVILRFRSSTLIILEITRESEMYSALLV